jgi:hypothetical protein
VRQICIILIALGGALIAAGCQQGLDTTWPIYALTPDTVRLFSLARADYLGLPAAYDFTDTGRLRVVVESPNETGNWDIALTEENGQLVFMPAGALQGVTSNAAIALVPDVNFDSLRAAPKATSTFVYADSTTIPVQPQSVYVVRTRTVSGLLGACTYFAKLQTIDVDEAGGTLLFEYTANPNCNDSSFRVNQ